ncbi:uncharacterized protein LOC129600232 [Paramacrobiotus metropolitanus]|uniref:uncharacterized protein LOC129600232 n=1 Tax=Paramacrobiotus metropolitanus TaxID=2943436 RepID=UPI002446537D|nr:uncharacterized protein LOC129600232 [Paramacrobiotus metropolitanus]
MSLATVLCPVLPDIDSVGEETNQFEYHALSQWMRACQQLLLVNFAIPTGRDSSLLHARLFDKASDWTWLKDRHRMVSELHPGAHLRIVIPFVRFYCTESVVEQCRRLIAALNNHCPTVTRRMTEKVTSMHGQWVRTLAYPDQWTGIRIFLNLASSIGGQQPWDGVDLRQMDVAVLSRLAMHILDEYFQD